MVKKTQTFTGIVRKDQNTDFSINFDGVSGLTTAETEEEIPKYVEDFFRAVMSVDAYEEPREKPALEIVAEHREADGDDIVGYVLAEVTHDDEADEDPLVKSEYHSIIDLTLTVNAREIIKYTASKI